MLLAHYIGRRLSLKPESRRRSSPGAIIAVSGIALALVIMLLSISVVTGFKKEIRDKVVGFNAQITIYPSDSFSDTQYTSGICLSDDIEALIREAIPEAETALMIRQPAVFKTDDAFQGIILKGIPAGSDADFIRQNITSGTMPKGMTWMSDSVKNSVIISRHTADALRLKPGDRINTHFLLDNNLRTRRLDVAAIYDTHFSDFDNLFAFVPIGFLQQFNKLDSLTGSAIEIRGIDQSQIRQAAESLDRTLNFTEYGNIRPAYSISNVEESNALYFNWLELLDTNVAVIITLMTVVSAFTLISSLFIIILERVYMIGLFKALGATDRLIRSIFIYLTERLVIRGMIIGNIIGIATIIIQHHFHILKLDPEAYYLNFVPMELNWLHVVVLNLGVLIISCAVLLIPSSAIARMSPANTIRYE